MSLVSILISYFALPVLALMMVQNAFDLKKKYMKIYPNSVVEAFNIKVTKVSVSLIFLISVLIFFFAVLTANTLEYLSILKLSSTGFFIVSGEEILIFFIILVLYLILDDTRPKKK